MEGLPNISESIIVIGLAVVYASSERRGLGSLHAREGPVFTGLHGLGQPLVDAGKLLSKSIVVSDNWFTLLLSYLLSFVCVITCISGLWLAWSYCSVYLTSSWSSCYFLVCLTILGGFGELLCGSLGFSRYSWLASCRLHLSWLATELGWISISCACGYIVSFNLEAIVAVGIGGLVGVGCC